MFCLKQTVSAPKKTKVSYLFFSQLYWEILPTQQHAWTAVPSIPPPGFNSFNTHTAVLFCTMKPLNPVASLEMLVCRTPHKSIQRQQDDAGPTIRDAMTN
jgi:hypothetical protein